MAKKSNKDNSNLPAQRLDSNSTNLIDKIVSEKDPGKLKDLVDLFNFNQNKKDILRADTYSKLLDKLSEEMYNRVNRGAVTLTNDELMEFHKTVTAAAAKNSISSDNVITPAIQNNTQVNINVGELNRESREKVADAVKAILAKIDKEENCETIQE